MTSVSRDGNFKTHVFVVDHEFVISFVESEACHCILNVVDSADADTLTTTTTRTGDVALRASKTSHMVYLRYILDAPSQQCSAVISSESERHKQIQNMSHVSPIPPKAWLP